MTMEDLAITAFREHALHGGRWYEYDLACLAEGPERTDLLDGASLERVTKQAICAWARTEVLKIINGSSPCTPQSGCGLGGVLVRRRADKCRR